MSSDGSVLAIGANLNDSANGFDSGHVRVYVWNGAAWIQRGADIDGKYAADWSGWSVAMSSDGSVLAIGAPSNDGNGSNSGHVRVYVWNGAAWIQRGADIDGEAAFDASGHAVALSSDGSVLAIGAYNNGVSSGHVRVYVWNGAAWIQRGADIDGEAAGDGSGWSVALSSDGSVLAIGAPFNDGVNGLDSGHVRVYAWDGAAWNQRGADIDGEAAVDWSGLPVALSSDGSVLAIGASSNDGVNGLDSGHVRVYVWNGIAWNQRGADIDGEAANDFSGYSVALSSDGSVLAIGALGNDGINGLNSGHVRVYVWNGISWNQRGADIDGEAADDRSGRAVALSSDGSVLAIGAYFNDGVNGLDSGHVRVYVWNGIAWIQRGADIDGEAAGDQSGYSVALSSDGTNLAIGAYLNNGVNGADSGHVRVHDYSTPSPTPAPTPAPVVPTSTTTSAPTSAPTSGGCCAERLAKFVSSAASQISSFFGN